MLIILFSIVLDNDLNSIVHKFSEHYHDAWANHKLENGWVYGEQFNDVNKSHPRLKPYMMLSEYVCLSYCFNLKINNNKGNKAILPYYFNLIFINVMFNHRIFPQ